MARGSLCRDRPLNDMVQPPIICASFLPSLLGESYRSLERSRREAAQESRQGEHLESSRCA